jgi:hypothetical protein
MFSAGCGTPGTVPQQTSYSIQHNPRKRNSTLGLLPNPAPHSASRRSAIERRRIGQELIHYVYRSSGAKDTAIRLKATGYLASAQSDVMGGELKKEGEETSPSTIDGRLRFAWEVGGRGVEVGAIKEEGPLDMGQSGAGHLTLQQPYSGRAIAYYSELRYGIMRAKRRAKEQDHGNRLCIPSHFSGA